MNLRLFEKGRLGRDRRPQLLDLNAGRPNIPESDGMVRRRPDTFSKPDIRDEAEIAIHNAERSLLGLQKKLLHSGIMAQTPQAV